MSKYPQKNYAVLADGVWYAALAYNVQGLVKKLWMCREVTIWNSDGIIEVETRN